MRLTQVHPFSVAILTILTSIALNGTPVVPCTIQFPSNIGTVPTLRIYCGGKIIPATIDQSTRTITFSVAYYPSQREFKLLVTEMIDFSFYLSKYQPEKNNTAAYIKLKDGQPYYLFTFGDLGSEPNSPYRWHIDKVTNNDPNNKIPDDAIILCMPPDWIQSIDNTTLLELPTIVIKSDMLTSKKAEKEFLERAVKLQLAAIDSDTMHDRASHLIKQDQNRIMIAAPAA